MFELSANQSMCMTGKGLGQDWAINPYYGTDSYAIVSNKGDYPISIRIMQGESMVVNKALKGKSKEKFRLKADEQLYFDTEYESKVALSFKKLD